MFSAAKTTAPSGAYTISRSVRLRSSATAWFSRAFAASGGTKWTYSGWVKRGQLALTAFNLMGGSVTSSNHCDIFFNSSDQLIVTWYNSTSQFNLTTTQVFRDPSAWYHVTVAFDSTDAASTNRLKVYVNGVQVTAFATASYPALNAAPPIYTTVTTQIGRYYDGTSYYGDGYLTEVNFIDGQALTPSSFGQNDSVTGVWQPKKYAGTYGTNGFYLNFSDNSAATAAAIGKDSSGNGNNWTPNNISVTAGVTYDSMIDVPTLWADGGNGRGNYAVLNPLDKNGTITNGNLTATTTSGYSNARGTFGISSGKWYWEQTIDQVTTTNAGLCQVSGGVVTAAYSLSAGSGSAGMWGFQNSNGAGTNSWKYDNGTGTNTYAVFNTGDVAGIALDMDSGSLSVYRNNTLLFTSSTSLLGNTVFPYISNYVSGQTATSSFNFGQRPFAYTPPTGFKALNTQNLPDSTIKKGNQYFDVSLYTGTGSTQTITNSGGFQPNLVWQKGRGEIASHRLVDSSRGVNNILYSNQTAVETVESGVLTAFNSNGFTGGGANVVTSGFAGVAWQWKAGGAAVSNTAGTITSQVSANPTAGFSVVTYTGTGANATVGHGLGVAPKMIISKSRNNANADSGFWDVYHASLTSAAYFLKLNTTDAQTSAPTVWNSTAPTSSVYSVGSASGTNAGTSATYVAYCFSEVAGFSKFGSYTGNGSADGPFVYCGFRPRFVMVKRIDAAGDWAMVDSSRNGYNSANPYLFANLSNSEYTTAGAFEFDFTANGFKVRNTGNSANTSGGTYVFMALAENPFKNSLAR